MKYTIKQFRAEFPNEDVCLEYLFNKRFEKECQCGGRYYHQRGRKSFVCSKCNRNVSPTFGTIMEKSATPLTLWFYALYLFSVSKNGVSAKELERQLGVTYKCAWRMANKIRSLMGDGGSLLNGIVEIDETYFGGKHLQKDKFAKKTALIGMTERGGRARVKKVPNRETHIILNTVKENISRNALIMSDEFDAYKKLSKLGYMNQRVKHGKKHWVRGNVHTNTVEGFWGQLKRSIKGTYHHVSSQHLQSYADEFAFRYSYRELSIFHALMGRI